MNRQPAIDSSSRLPTEGLTMTAALLALSQLTLSAAPATEKVPKTTPENTALQPLIVEADTGKKLYNPENLSTQKYTVPVRDIPQSVTVISQQVMQDQGVANLRDVLKNVPGISMQAGEGGVPPGDNLAIRGFNARTDLFIDGVRDFGGYSRDPFNVEQVEVTKGPASTNAGRGSTGGSINLSSKTPHLGNDYRAMLGGGSDNYTRASLDLNQEIPGLKGTAARLNGVFHHQDTPGRDEVEQERWGIAPSITFGLDTDTRFTLGYFHLRQNNLPDYGLPWVPRDNPLTPANENITGLPSGPTNVDDKNFYGLLSRDYEEIQTDILTATLDHDFNKDLSLRNITRLGRTDNNYILTAPSFYSPTTKAPKGASPTAVRRADRNRDQIDTIFSNQTELRYDFATGSVKHQLVAALEVSREKSENRLRTDLNAANIPPADLRNPNPHAAYASNYIYNGAVTSSTADTIALSVFDTVKLNDQWMLSGGLRWDSFDVEYDSRAATAKGVQGALTQLGRKDELLSYRGAVTYKPIENASIYLGYGTSFNPSAQGLTLSESATSTSNVNTKPEKNQTLELGGKWDVLDEKLSLTGALFRTDKTNARTEDPTDPADIIVLEGEQRVQGFEFGFTGLVTDQWRIIGGYTFLDSEIRSSKNALEQGSEISNTPEHSLSLWTVHDLPAGFQVGIGTQFVGSRFSNNNSSTRQQAPSYALIDALIGYKLNENVSFRLNAYNLADKDYIDRVGGGHYIPGQGRSVALTADFNF